MAINIETQHDHYAVFGNPIAHSQSPAIHQAFAEQQQQDVVYQANCVAAEQFATEVRTFFAQGGKGLNITLPYKRDAYELADHLSQRAQQAGAVNTLTPEQDGTIEGDNTDGVGLLRDLNHLHWPIQHKQVLLLGAGGAARGVLAPLLQAKPAALVIANRSLDKAQALVTDFAKLDLQCTLQARALTDLAGLHFDLIINASSAGLTGDFPQLPPTLLSGHCYCYDMSYAAEATPFIQWAKTHGAVAVSDGWGMLVEQAAEAFYLWRGVKPDTAPVIAWRRRNNPSCH